MGTLKLVSPPVWLFLVVNRTEKKIKQFVVQNFEITNEQICKLLATMWATKTRVQAAN